MPESGPDPTERGDPFLVERDPGEAAVGELIREHLLEATPPADVFRQDGGDDGYALIVPRSRGARTLTVPAADEADFMWHGNPDTTANDLASFIVSAIAVSRADHLRIPMLTRQQAVHLARRLNDRLPDWRLDVALTAVSPFSTRKTYEPSILKKAMHRSRRDGALLDIVESLPVMEVKALHDEQWGPNRGREFFAMLSQLRDAGFAEVALARTELGHLVAAQVDILGTRTRHCYYVLSDTSRAPGCGTALLALLWQEYMRSTQGTYSFGRGAERYKYQYAERVHEWYALRGFYMPCHTDDLLSPGVP